MQQFSLSQVNAYNMAKQHLSGESAPCPIEQLAGDICGLHATGNLEPYMAAFARNPAFHPADLDNALTVTRSLVKFRFVRSTLYILPGEFVPVAYSAMRLVVEKNSERFAAFMGITPGEYELVSRHILRLVRERPLSTLQIKKEIGGDRHFPSILNLMCDRAILARVPSGKERKLRTYTFLPFEEYLPDIDLTGYSEEDAVFRLAHAYVRTFGPVREKDVIWWSGLPAGKCRAALKRLAPEMAAVGVSELHGEFFILAEQLADLAAAEFDPPNVNVLPLLDPYLMGYRLRDRFVDPAQHGLVYDRGGNATTAVLVDGIVRGVWDISSGHEVKYYLFEKVTARAEELIHRKLEAMGRFINGHDLPVQRVTDMVPLAERTAGGFMSPLRRKDNK